MSYYIVDFKDRTACAVSVNEDNPFNNEAYLFDGYETPPLFQATNHEEAFFLADLAHAKLIKADKVVKREDGRDCYIFTLSGAYLKLIKNKNEEVKEEVKEALCKIASFLKIHREARRKADGDDPSDRSYKKIDYEKIELFETLPLPDFFDTLEQEMYEMAFLIRKSRKKYLSYGEYDRKALIEIRNLSLDLEKIFTIFRKKAMEYRQNKKGA